MKTHTAFKKTALSLALTATFCQMSFAATSDDKDEQTNISTIEERLESVSRDKGKDVEKIEITGSHIGGTGFVASSPITIVSAADLEKSAPSTLAAALNNLPALVAQGGPNASSGQRNSGRNYLNLRGIGVGRTLVLVNGRRFPGSSPGGTVDTNLIPQALVSRVDVVTGGASAAYGSDAVAGVINFVLDDTFEGFKSAISTGISEEGDGSRTKLSATWGDGFIDDKLHVALSGEIYRSQAVAGDARPHRVRGRNMIPNPGVTADTATPDNPLYVVVDEARETSSYGGLIISARQGRRSVDSPLIGNQFLSGGDLAPFDYGTLASDDGYQNGGDGVNTAIMQRISRPLDRSIFYAGLNYQATDSLKLFTNMSLGKSESSNSTFSYHSGRYGITIKPENAFLSSAISQQMVDEGLSSIRIERWDSEYEMEVVSENESKRIELGFEADLGDYYWEMSAQWGENVEDSPNYNNYIPDLYRLGVDSVVDPNTGEAVCRSTLEDDPNNGCVAINPFGQGSYTSAMIDYFTGTSSVQTKVRQKIFQSKVTGELFSGIGAGAWDFATGFEYRDDYAAITADEMSVNNEFFTNNQQSWAADRSVREGFIEINAPLLEESEFAKYLVMNAAARRTNYSVSGDVSTWKLGMNYQPSDEVRIRASRSRDIRAPNHTELFSQGRQKLATYVDYLNDGATVRNVLTRQTGNPALVPEIADTTVVGIVYNPDWAKGLAISIDRFDIKMQDAMRSLSEQTVVDFCEIGFEQACSAITRDEDGNLQEVRNSKFNLDELRLTGWDLEGRYRVPIAEGRLMLKAHIGYMETLKYANSDGEQVDRSGETETPEWRGLFSASYKMDQYSAFLQARYIGSNVIDLTRTASEYEYNDVPSVLYFDAQLGYEYSENIRVSLNIQNLLNKEPAFAPQEGVYFSPTDPNVYNQVGRYFNLGIRFNY